MESADLTGAGAPRRLSADARRRQIIEAAKELFRADPDASLNEIAERAGCTRQLVSRYFPGGGTTAIISAILDDWDALIFKTFAGGMEIGRAGPDRAREASDYVVGRYLSATLELDQPWVFSDGRDRTGSGTGERWSQTLGALVEILLSGRPEAHRNPLTRTALRAEIASGNVVVIEMLEGRLSRDEAQRVVVEGMVSCLENVLPRLVD